MRNGIARSVLEQVPACQNFPAIGNLKEIANLSDAHLQLYQVPQSGENL